MEENEINNLSDKYYMYKGLILAPLASVIGSLLVDIVALVLGFSEHILSAGFLFIIAISYIVLAFVGMPIFYILKFYNLINIWSLLVAAIFVSYSIAFLLGTPNIGSMYTIVPAISVALAFWYIYTHRDPNKALKRDAQKASRPLA